MPQFTSSIDFLGYKNRVIKKLWPVIVAILLVFIFWFSKPKSHWLTLLIFLTTLIVWGLCIIFNAKRFVNKIEICDDTISISGYDYNKFWNENFKLGEVDIKIKFVGRGKGHYEYTLIFRTPKKSYIINDLFNWNYLELIKIFEEFKKAKNEKVIFDDRYFLNIMEKKAHGLSEIDIFLNKEIKKD